METTELGTAYLDQDWEHGLACMDCLRVLREGDRYAERLYAFTEDAPVVELVCVECATATAALGGSDA